MTKEKHFMIDNVSVNGMLVMFVSTLIMRIFLGCVNIRIRIHKEDKLSIQLTRNAKQKKTFMDMAKQAENERPYLAFCLNLGLRV